jgi:hypothetical protein
MVNGENADVLILESEHNLSFYSPFDFSAIHSKNEKRMLASNPTEN